MQKKERKERKRGAREKEGEEKKEEDVEEKFQINLNTFVLPAKTVICCPLLVK